MSFAHPPLANALQSAPAVLSGDLGTLEVREVRAWDTSMDPGAASLELLALDDEGARTGLMKARAVSGVLFVGSLVYFYGFRCGIASRWQATLFAAAIGLNPSVLGHARVAATDLPAAIAITAAKKRAATSDSIIRARFFPKLDGSNGASAICISRNHLKSMLSPSCSQNICDYGVLPKTCDFAASFFTSMVAG